MATLTLQQRLDAAEDAYDLLMIGKTATVYADADRSRIEYKPADAPRLAAYIRSLKFQIDPASVLTAPLRGFYA